MNHGHGDRHVGLLVDIGQHVEVVVICGEDEVAANGRAGVVDVAPVPGGYTVIGLEERSQALGPNDGKRGGIRFGQPEAHPRFNGDVVNRQVGSKVVPKVSQVVIATLDGSSPPSGGGTFSPEGVGFGKGIDKRVQLNRDLDAHNRRRQCDP